MDQNKIVAGGLITAVLACIIAIGYIIYTQGSSQKTALPEQSSSSPQGGTVAVLAQGSASPQQQTSQPNRSTPAQQIEAVTSLPAEWTTTETRAAPPCGTTDVWQSRGWQSGTKSLTIFESDTAVSCDAPFAADTSVSYTFRPNEPTVLISADNAYSICTKDQNQQCPRGDGRLSVMLTNLDNTKNTVLHPTTKKSYVLVIQDTTLSSDLSAQAQTLAKSLETVSFYLPSATTQE